MSRKLALALVALGTLASTALIAESANAMTNHGGASVRGSVRVNTPNRIRVNVRIPHTHDHGHDHHRYRYVWWHHRHIPVGYVVGDYVANPGPCTCLTKEYTPEGQVVFKDLCTKEMAMAPVDGTPAQSGEAADPNNFAGKTYQDYLAANPQAQAQAPKN